VNTAGLATNSNFNDTFSKLTGEQPFPWQAALFQLFISGEIPHSCNLPTGLGKTSVVAIWLIALACRPEKIPRRLVCVVNRRTVVDQTTDEVEKMRRNIDAAGLGEPLKQLCAFDDDCPLGISTLRGQFADNREWSADPARPAVIVGTVALIGRQLPFSGYGVALKLTARQARRRSVNLLNRKFSATPMLLFSSFNLETTHV